MSPDASREISYGDFNRQRSALLGKINRLKQEYKRATDDRYTALVENPGQYALAELSRTEIELGNLIAVWELQQSNKGVKP